MAPSLVLVPGMSSIGSVFYVPLKQELGKIGFDDVIVVDLPSVDSTKRTAELIPNALEVDIKYIHGIVQRLAEEGKDVIVVAHSYGGTPSLYASEGLWKHERQARGSQGGVLKAALMSSSLSLPGTSIAAIRAAWSAEHMPEMNVAQEKSVVEVIDGVPFVFPVGFGAVFLTDLSAKEQREWEAKALRPHPLSSVLTNAPQANVSSWRIAYLITAELDPTMPVRHQQFLIDNAKEHGAVVEEVKTIRSGHFVQVTHAEEVAVWIKELSSS